MANDAAWNEGWQQGRDSSAYRRNRKDMLTDEQHAIKRDDILGNIQSAKDQLKALKGADGNVSPENQAQFDKITGLLGNHENDLHQLYDPIKAPGRLQQDWHLLREKVHGIAQPKTPTSVTSQSPAVTLNTPAAPLQTPDLPGIDPVKGVRVPSQEGSAPVKGTTGPGMANAPVATVPMMITQSFEGKLAPGQVSQGNLDLAKRPNIDNGDGTHSSTFSMSFGTDKGEVLVPGVGDGKTYPERQLRVLYTLPDGSQKWAVPGNQPHNWIAPERPTPQNNEALNQYQKTGKNFGTFEDEKAADAYGKKLHEDQEKYGHSGTTENPVSLSGNITLPAGPKLTVTKAPPVPWGQAQVLKQQAAAMQKAQQEAGLLAAGAGLSPQQQAVVEANSANAGELARIQGQIKNYKTLNPDATAEDVSAYASSLMPGNNQIGNWERVDGTLDGQFYGISYDKKRGVYKLPDNTISSTPPENWKPVAKASGNAAENIQEYNALPNPKPPYAQWLSQQTSSGKGLAWDTATGQVKGGPDGRRYNPWDTDLPPNVKEMFASQAKMLDKKQAMAMALAAARGASFANAKMVDVQDKNNPGQNILVPAGLAYKLGYNTPNGAYYSAMTNMLKDATSGQIGNEFVAFGTALEHADQLGRAAVALSNGDSRRLNSISNSLSTAFGDPAVTNFDVVSQVYTGEITKAINAGHVTQSELQDNHALIPANASPEQISGAITNFKKLLNSKINNRVPQIQSALGKFGMATPFMPPGYKPPVGSGNNGNTPATKGTVSIAKAKLKDKYKGMTDKEISDAITAAHYTPVP